MAPAVLKKPGGRSVDLSVDGPWVAHVSMCKIRHGPFGHSCFLRRRNVASVAENEPGLFHESMDPGPLLFSTPSARTPALHVFRRRAASLQGVPSYQCFPNTYDHSSADGNVLRVHSVRPI